MKNHESDEVLPSNDSASVATEMSTAPNEQNNHHVDHVLLLTESYRRWTGRELIESEHPPVIRARALFESDFVVASHGTGPDPVFTYANRAALRLFESGWSEFTAMPSRLSAEPLERAQRAQLLEQVNKRGYIDDYSGVRITTTGRRFRIRNATVWNLVDARGVYRGQAVLFQNWEYL